MSDFVIDFYTEPQQVLFNRKKDPNLIVETNNPADWFYHRPVTALSGLEYSWYYFVQTLTQPPS